MQACSNEGCSSAAVRSGECWGCYSYRRRHGRARDLSKVERRRIARNVTRLENELHASFVGGIVRAATRTVNAVDDFSTTRVQNGDSTVR